MHLASLATHLRKYCFSQNSVPPCRMPCLKRRKVQKHQEGRGELQNFPLNMFFKASNKPKSASANNGQCCMERRLCSGSGSTPSLRSAMVPWKILAPFISVNHRGSGSPSQTLPWPVLWMQVKKEFLLLFGKDALPRTLQAEYQGNKILTVRQFML